MVCLALAALAGPGWPPVHAKYGEFELRFEEDSDQKPLAVRFHVFDSQGRPRKLRGVPGWGGHHLVDGSTVLKLAPGTYRFLVERGPEYRDIQGSFEIRSGATDSRTISVSRIVEMRDKNWWSGDCLVRREPRDVPLAMAADDLHFALVTSSPPVPSESELRPDTDLEIAPLRWSRWDGSLDSSEGGRLIFVGCQPGELLRRLTPANPASAAVLMAAAKSSAELIWAADAAARDLPIWIASRRLNGMCVLGPSLLREEIQVPASGWRDHDPTTFRSADAAGKWAEHVYYQALNCGLRIVPLAASGSGINSNPVGYNRIYAHFSETPSPRAWWSSVRDGHVVITNGPLMLPSVNNEMPGHVFRTPAGQKITLQPSLSLYTRDKVDYLEIIRDGRVLHAIPLDRWAKDSGRLPSLLFERSGWIAIRAVAQTESTYRMCLAGPYYVEIGDKPRVSRAAVQFFMDWLDAIDSENDELEPAERRANQPYLRAARKFWREQLENANAD